MSYNLPLDIISTSTCSGSYSTIRTSTLYTGPTLNIRRSSDNATSDFYSNPYGQIGTGLNGSGTSLTSWLGTSTGYITIWYDQSGKNNHAIQSNTNYQPTIDITNNYIDFTSGNSFFNLPTGTVPNKILEGTYQTAGNTYISTNSSARTTLITSATTNTLNSVFDGAIYATVIMNGDHVVGDKNTYYISGSRTNINASNEFNMTYGFYFSENNITKCVVLTFRLYNNTIDVYQSNGFYYNGNVSSAGPSYTINPNIGSSGYGVTNISLQLSYAPNILYLSVDPNARTPLISESVSLENIYDSVLTATIAMNGNWIGSWTSAKYLSNSRTPILDNQFSVVYAIIGGGSAKCVTIIFRLLNNMIDMYQSNAFFYKAEVNDYSQTTYEPKFADDFGTPVGIGSSGYGVVYFSIKSNPSTYTVILKHSDINNQNGCWLGCGGNGYTINTTNNFSRTSLGYVNSWYGNGYTGNNVYNAGNVVTYAYDGSYNYLYVNEVSQGISPIRSGWNGIKGNEYIGRDNNSENYFNGKMSFLYLFKSFLSINERTLIERGSYIINPTGPIKFSSLREVCGLLGSSISFSQIKKITGDTNNQPSTVSSLTNFSLQNGLFMRYYSNLYFANDPNFFNNNIPTYTGITTNLRNTYAATCGFNNSNRGEDITIGGITAKIVYSVEWTGVFYAPVSGTYTFYLQSDDSSYLWLGDNALSGYTTANCLINSNYNGGIEVSTSINLVAGQYYPIRIQFGDGGGFQFLKFRFTLPNGTFVYEGTGYYYCQATPSNQIYSNYVSNSNLLMYFPFELSDQSGTSLANNAINLSYEATLYNGAIISSGDYKVGPSLTSLSLTASSSQYVQTANFTPTANGLTFSFWYKSNGSGLFARIFDFGNGMGNNNILFSINGDNLNKLACSCFYESSYQNFYISDANYNDNKWRHITWTLNYAPVGSFTSTWNIYINGVFKATTSNYYPSIYITRYNCYIGKSNWVEYDAYYNGYIDDFRVYNRVLSATEILNIYSYTQIYTNLVSNNKLIMYYPFETSDKNGTKLANNANQNNIIYDATLYNGATVSTGDYKVGLSFSSLSLSAPSNQFVRTPNFTPTTNGLTFSFWYKSNGTGVWGRIFDFGNSAQNNNILCSINGGGNSLAVNCFYGSSDNNVYLTDINYNDNQWRHITWTLTYATPGSFTSTWKIYVNGLFKRITVGYYPSPTVTRTTCYIGKSNWTDVYGVDAYYNGYIDDFRVYNRVLTQAEIKNIYYYKYNTIYTYSIKNGNNTITTQIQGTTPQNPATSGYAIYLSNPWLPNNYYWIKSESMTIPVQMYIDIKNGGFDYYNIDEGISVNYITQEHSGTPLGLELIVPRSQTHWKSIYNYIYNVLGSNYTTYLKTINIYKDTSFGNYSGYAMFDPRYGNSGSTTGSYNGAPDWRTKDGGLWYAKDSIFSEPNGDYYAYAFIGTYGDVYFSSPFMTNYYSTGFNDANAGYYTGPNYIVSTNYAGSTVSTLYTYFDGSTADRAAPSALYIKNQTGTNTNGIYWINLPVVGPTQIYCIMDSDIDGGGWMMVMKTTRGSTFQFSSSHWTTISTLNPSDNTRNDADAKFNTMNYFQSKDMLALFPDIPYNYNSGTGGSLTLPTYNNWCWMKNNYNSGVRQTLINYFSTASNFSFGTAIGVERGTAFSSQGGNNFYGINFTLNQAGSYRHVRWGFGWNNETQWLSNDSTGGIGMSNPAYSSGDFSGDIGAGTQTGINRSARVEMYVR